MAVQSYTHPSPTGGLDLVSPIDNMEPSRALELVNVVPGSSAPKTRKGYDLFTTPQSGAQIGTLASLPLTDGTYKVVATTSNKFWDVTTGTSAEITGATVPTSREWNSAVFANRLFFCNGVDTVQVYTGTGNAADSTFSGVTLGNLINVSSYKERLYFVEKNTLKFWYGNTQAVGASALTSYDLQYTFRRGGRLLFAGSWTNQLASTSADLFFACSSEGELLFYSGSYPGDANWSLVARFVIGKPLSYRSFLRVDNDVWIVTSQGIVPISQLFSVGAEAAVDTVSLPVNPVIAQYAESIGFSHLWHGIHAPRERKVFIVIPISGSEIIYLVYCTETKAWCRYELQNSKDGCAITVSSDVPFWASSDGKVFKGEYLYSDDGSTIPWSLRSAFSFYGSRGNYKAFKDLRPLLKGPGSLQVEIGIDTDFKREATLSPVTYSQGTFTPYGSPYGSLYSSDAEYLFTRFPVKGQGHSGAIRMAGTVLDSQIEFYGFELRFDVGGQV